MAKTGFVYLDVSELPAPEPLQKALEALAELPQGQVLHFHHRQRPTLLYERLEHRGFDQLTRTNPEGTVDVFIWRQADEAAASQARHAAQKPGTPGR